MMHDAGMASRLLSLCARDALFKVASLGPKVTASDLGDTSTLADPGVVEVLIASHAMSASQRK